MINSLDKFYIYYISIESKKENELFKYIGFKNKEMKELK